MGLHISGPSGAAHQSSRMKKARTISASLKHNHCQRGRNQMQRTHRAEQLYSGLHIPPNRYGQGMAELLCRDAVIPHLLWWGPASSKLRRQADGSFSPPCGMLDTLEERFITGKLWRRHLVHQHALLWRWGVSCCNPQQRCDCEVVVRSWVKGQPHEHSEQKHLGRKNVRNPFVNPLHYFRC